MLFWCFHHAVVILILHGSGLTASRSRRSLVLGLHKLTSWIDIRSSDSHVVPRSNTSGLRRYFLRPELPNYWLDCKKLAVVPISFRTCKGKDFWWQVSTCWRLVGRERHHDAIGRGPYSSNVVRSAIFRDKIWEAMWNCMAPWLFRTVGFFASVNSGCRYAILNFECCL